MTTEKNAKDSAHLIVCIGTNSRSCRPAAVTPFGDAPVSSAGANRGDHGWVERYRSRGGPAARPTRWLAPRARGTRPGPAPATRPGRWAREPVRCDVRATPMSRSSHAPRRRAGAAICSCSAPARHGAVSLDEADGRRLPLGARSELPRADPRVLGALAAARRAQRADRQRHLGRRQRAARALDSRTAARSTRRSPGRAPSSPRRAPTASR